MDYKKRNQIEALSDVIYDMKKHVVTLDWMEREETDRDFKQRLIRLRKIIDDAYENCVSVITKLEQDEFNN